jgi:hypothetical protein
MKTEEREIRRKRRVRIPNKLARQIAEADDPLGTGITLSADALVQMASIPGVSGVNILYDGDPNIVADTLKAAGIGT